MYEHKECVGLLDVIYQFIMMLYGTADHSWIVTNIQSIMRVSNKIRYDYKSVKPTRSGNYSSNVIIKPMIGCGRLYAPSSPKDENVLAPDFMERYIADMLIKIANNVENVDAIMIMRSDSISTTVASMNKPVRLVNVVESNMAAPVQYYLEIVETLI